MIINNKKDGKLLELICMY